LSTQQAKGRDPHSYTILLVEDHADVRLVLRATLEQEGHTVLTANDGNSAFRLCLEMGGGIDVVITDIVLPGINGIDLVDLFQAQWPQIRAILLSGQIEQEMLRERPPRIPFISKPVAPEDLLQAARKALQR
jgi:two-component system cell cycle sensor histidine kinase/response regulator CckA